MPTITAAGSAIQPMPTSQGYAYGQSQFYESSEDVDLFVYNDGTYIRWRGGLSRLDFVIDGIAVAMIECNPPVGGVYLTNGALRITGQLYESPFVADRYHTYGGWIQFEPLYPRFRIGVGSPPATAMEIYGNGNIVLADLIERAVDEPDSPLPLSLFEGIFALTATGELTVSALYEEQEFVIAVEAPAPSVAGTATRAIDSSGAASIVAPSVSGWASNVWRCADGEPELSAPSVSGVADREISSLGAGVLTAPVIAGTVTRRTQARGNSPSIVAPSISGAAYRALMGAVRASVPTASGTATRAIESTGAAVTPAATASGASTHLWYYEATGAATTPAATASGTGTLLRYYIGSGAAITPAATTDGTAYLAWRGAATAGAPTASGTVTRAIPSSGSPTAVAPSVFGRVEIQYNYQTQLYRVTGIKRMAGTGIAVATLESITRPLNR